MTVHHDLAGAGRLARRGTAVATSRAVARRVGAERVIHPGVDLQHWALPNPPPGPPRALMLGALVPVKRVELALEIAARMPELSLDIVGAALPGDPPEYERRLRSRAVDRVRFLGALADPRPALEQAHCLLHCGDQEAFGLALVEALAAGRPVVAPDAGGPAEIVTPTSGRLFRPGDADSAVVALREALAADLSPRRRAADFDRDESARRFAEVVRGSGT